MRRFMLLLVMAQVFFLLPGCLKADEVPDVWAKCAVAEDCVIVGTGCAVAAVHKTYQAEADAYYRHRNSMMDCEPQVDPATAGVQCGHQKMPCKDIWGRIDHASTCASADAVCQVVPRPVRAPVVP